MKCTLCRSPRVTIATASAELWICHNCGHLFSPTDDQLRKTTEAAPSGRTPPDAPPVPSTAARK